MIEIERAKFEKAYVEHYPTLIVNLPWILDKDADGNYTDRHIAKFFEIWLLRAELERERIK